MGVAPEDLARTLLRRAAVRHEADGRARNAALAAVSSSLQALRPQLHFARAWLIGSLAWGGFGERSDIDLVIEGASERALHVIAEEVGRASGRLVDAMALEALPSRFAARVLAEGRIVT